MSDLSALYQDLILDHNRRPRHYGKLADANRVQEGHNPMCGDQITVWLRLEGEVIADATFVASGCAISRASASMMTSALNGKTRAEADALFDDFHAVVTGAAPPRPELGPLAALSGVSRFPLRVKCASLAWHAMRAALHGPDTPPEAPDTGAPEPTA